MKIESTLIFLNIQAPFYILNGLCTGKVEYQAILAENENGEMVLDSLDPVDISTIIFAGNELGCMGYKEYRAWAQKVNLLMNCDVNELIHNSAEGNIDKNALTEYASKIQLPNQKPNSNCNCKPFC